MEINDWNYLTILLHIRTAITKYYKVMSCIRMYVCMYAFDSLNPFAGLVQLHTNVLLFKEYVYLFKHLVFIVAMTVKNSKFKF